ncbi:AAA family ATPase [Streptomyces sp. WI04-05B]|uniref:AAA family ATPase n=1 Tax=Streptomyces TaxID=1883 RepID=UPI0029A4ADF1|nr:MULTISPECIES: AAA family ATPase [unclassified Streptomyces]MDX2547742.1 AAA family ATPase [Streptomyces sp. WI04-05B]MDX2590055.1 AAA family ATPase [Streptomyces sp. WI04-05A]
MRISRITARGFLSFSEFSMDVGQGLTVVTGPNAAGKSNLCQVLSAVSAYLGRHRDPEQRDLLSLYEQAGHNEAPTFTLTVSFELDQPGEQDLVTAFVKASYISTGSQNTDAAGPTTEAFEQSAETSITTESVAALFHGTLRLDFDSHRRPGWSCAWQFNHGEDTFHIQLEGPCQQQLRRGAARGWKTAAVDRVITLHEMLAPRPAPVGGPPPAPALVDFPAVLDGFELPIVFNVPTLNDGSSPRPVSVTALAQALGLTEQHSVTFDAVLGKIWAAGVSVTVNRRLPARRHFSLDELVSPLDLSDGSRISAQLYRLKNGAHDQREGFRRAQEMFHTITGAHLEVQASPETDGMAIDVVIDAGHGERRAEFSGAGLQEAVLLAVLAADGPGRVIVLDEPAVQLHPTMQRRIATTALRDVQALLITHSADLVPVATPTDLERIVRLAPGPDGATTVRRPSATTASQLAGWIQNLAAADTRALLFARAVILCEGATETGALGQWWNTGTQPGPETANVPLLDVGGQCNFGGYINYLTAFGIPWAVIADGPALRGNSALAKQLAKQQLRPPNPPDDADDFTAWTDYWKTAGVFTLADQFGDGGSKSGELEAYLRRLDPQILDQAQRDTTSKPRVGALFAIRYPKGTPPHVAALYKEVAARLSLI